MSAPITLPRWADLVLVPVLSVLTAFVVGGLVVAAIGVSPWDATRTLITGSLGSGEALGFTLYYTTDFIFTGLAVALAFQAGLFNIGGEGQATLGGLGAALVCLHGGFLPGWLLIPLGIVAAAVFGGIWGLVPGYLQAKRGSHIVITTIMFNWLASTLMGYLLVNGMRAPQSMEPETVPFPPQAAIPTVHGILEALGIPSATTPLNLSFLLALACAFAMWLFIWRTRTGYEIRTTGANPTAAVYGGIAPAWIIMLTMGLSGALASGVAVNEIMGVQNRLLLEFTAGYGFVGIAVALMGRAHPVGIVFASLLFGILYQGGAELAFDQPKISRDMIVAIQGFVVLFAGALDGLYRPHLARIFTALPRTRSGPI
ncbi:ABC transporter permease [Lichenifustis flavocetrariae]|uniref:ABC transporter permease n=1 Tax=Lichenifustis flavocetrariae TaxID=2949735 RepID=A0AA41YU87_9HYPH|nr:ABC transporter permease [Lichenifustis flavocetrariae]MCW6507410.1 ABC transporter permease [Lichenifustis flavocetrariae]